MTIFQRTEKAFVRAIKSINETLAKEPLIDFSVNDAGLADEQDFSNPTMVIIDRELGILAFHDNVSTNPELRVRVWN
jgi:hypothetical protein